MLTDSEKEWLKKRETFLYYSCQHCWRLPVYTGRRRDCLQGSNRKDKHGKRLLVVCATAAIHGTYGICEAAEFEARVAAKLATAWKDMLDYYDYIPCDACPCHDDYKCTMDCHESILKWARLEVEKEMDNE